jgi:formate/nitrite transporter FocA (FNT family)
MAEEAHVELDPIEAEDVEERRLPAPHVVFETIRLEGEHELGRSASALLFSGLAAGLSMGFSLIACAVLYAHLPDSPWRALVADFGYSTGFVIVILGRQQLFTENTITAVLPALVAFNPTVLRKLARLWGLVLGANLCGCALIALALATTPIVAPADQGALSAVAQHAIGLDPPSAFWRAIVAGWILALMVWLLPASEAAAKPLIIVALTYLIAICGFSHIIAGSVDMFYELFRGHTTVRTALDTFFLPTLCGNTLGGVLLVSMLSFGQVFEDHITAEPKHSAPKSSARQAQRRPHAKTTTP